MVMCLLWLNRTAATARPPTLVCRPSSRALRLQVPLPTIRARAPLDLSVLIVVECAALLVSPSRSNHRLVHACMHAWRGTRFCLYLIVPSGTAVPSGSCCRALAGLRCRRVIGTLAVTQLAAEVKPLACAHAHARRQGIAFRGS
jgi:hypothetical protein